MSVDAGTDVSSSGSPVLRRPAVKRTKTSDVPNTAVTVLEDPLEAEAQDLLHKLQSSDVLDYPRRRAVIACEICRSRKSRCDGGRPRCKLCTELDAECVYREPGVKLDAGDKLILTQLNRIEHLIQSRLTGTNTTSYSPTTSHAASDDLARSVPTIDGITTGSVALNGVGTWSSNISAIPKAHTTPALHLLKWPVIRDLVSRPCDPHVLLQLEAAREPLVLVPSSGLDFSDMSTYVHAFFREANVWYAIVDPNSWSQYYRKATINNFSSGPESCVVLLVMALGQAAHSGNSMAQTVRGTQPPGIRFYSAATELLPSLLIRNDIVSAQCHILTAAYLMYLVRPLEAWNLLYNASMKLQLLLSAATSIPQRFEELSVRAYWDSLMIESDLLAELDLPQSGIVQLEDDIRLPKSFPYDTSAARKDLPPNSDSLWYFLAEIALRRLLNRVSHLIYSQNHDQKRSTSFSAASLEPVVAELDFQLNQWYEQLPAPLKFPRDHVPNGDRIQTVLRLRYYACQTIIYRPYIQAVLVDESLAQEAGVQDACRKCLHACIRQLEDVAAHREGHLPYLWQGALSLFSQCLLLMAATLSRSLSPLLPDLQETDRIIFHVIEELERLAHLAPSLRQCSEIIREAEERRRTTLHGPSDRRQR